MESLTVPASMEYLSLVMDKIEEFLLREGCPAKKILTISVSVEELFTNIASYAYPSDREEGKVRIAYGCSFPDKQEREKEAMIQLFDWGIPYNPFARKDPDLTLSIEEKPVGGLGVYMVKVFMNRTEYQYRDGCNILTITDRFVPEPEGEGNEELA